MTEEVSPSKGEFPKMAIAVSAIALILALAAIGIGLLAPASPAVATREFTVSVSHAEIIGCVNESTGSVVTEESQEECHQEVVGEFHRWAPGVIVVNKGDTVKLTVRNAMHRNHGLEIPEYGVETPKLLGMEDNPPFGSEVTLTFVADKSGVFQWNCNVEHEHGTNDCSEDHHSLIGYLIVQG